MAIGRVASPRPPAPDRVARPRWHRTLRLPALHCGSEGRAYGDMVLLREFINFYQTIKVPEARSLRMRSPSPFVKMGRGAGGGASPIAPSWQRGDPGSDSLRH